MRERAALDCSLPLFFFLFGDVDCEVEILEGIHDPKTEHRLGLLVFAEHSRSLLDVAPHSKFRVQINPFVIERVPVEPPEHERFRRADRIPDQQRASREGTGMPGKVGAPLPHLAEHLAIWSYLIGYEAVDLRAVGRVLEVEYVCPMPVTSHWIPRGRTGP